MNIILIGMMGSGKSTIGKELYKELNLQLVDTDELIEKNSQMSIKEIFEIHGESYFRSLERSTFMELTKINNSILSTGGGAVLSDTLLPFEGQCIVYLKWTTKSLLSNLTNKVDNRPLLNDASLEEKLSSILDVRKSLYEKWAKHIINCDGKSVEDIVLAISNIYKKL